MGQRANFEENYSGHTFQGSYIAGIYYPDKTKWVGGKMAIQNILLKY
jgi:trehalose/maltose hydrolase-like predicted phosphorylase